MSEGRLRLTIVGGFLGSGKTTWLRHQLFAGSFSAAHVIVNEAAGTPVDHSLLEGTTDQTVLAGGCACCDGSQTFQDALLEICDARSQMPDPTQRVGQLVLETSGLADPAAIVDLIQSHPVLIRHIVVHETIVVVDALYGQTALETEPVAQTQIRAADRLILTKIDLAGPTETGRLRRMLNMLVPGAAQSGSSFGSPVDLPTMAATTVLLPKLAADSVAITTCQLDLGPDPDWTALTLWLSALLHAHGDRIVRVKGVICSPAGRLLVQAVRNRVQSPEVLPQTEIAAPEDNRLVLIGSGLSSNAIERSFQLVRDTG